MRNQRRPLIFIVLALGSCGPLAAKKPKKGVDFGPVKSYFVHGNPKQLLQDSQMAYQPIFNTKNFSEFSNYNLFGITTFSQRSELSETDANQESVEESNKASEDQSQGKVSKYQWCKGNEPYVFCDGGDIATNKLALNYLSDDEGHLRLTSFSGVSAVTDLQVLYESVTRDRSAFSILAVHHQTTDSQILLDDAFHLRFNGLKILVRNLNGLRKGKIVIKTMIDHGSDGHLGARP